MAGPCYSLEATCVGTTSEGGLGYYYWGVALPRTPFFRLLQSDVRELCPASLDFVLRFRGEPGKWGAA
jgi:hypothetical protein